MEPMAAEKKKKKIRAKKKKKTRKMKKKMTKRAVVAHSKKMRQKLRHQKKTKKDDAAFSKKKFRKMKTPVGPEKIWIESEKAWCEVSQEFLEFKALHDCLHTVANDFGSVWLNQDVDVEWHDTSAYRKDDAGRSFGLDQVEVFLDPCSSDPELHFFDAVEYPSEWRKPPFKKPREKKKVDRAPEMSRPFRPWKHRRTIGSGRDVAVRKADRVPYRTRCYKRRAAMRARRAKHAAHDHWNMKFQPFGTPKLRLSSLLVVLCPAGCRKVSL